MKPLTPPVDASEGVIKYQLAFRQAAPLDSGLTRELIAWRDVLYRLGLTGMDTGRYEGLAYGNVSLRLQDSGMFIISGTRTGGLARLGPDHFSRILSFDLATNQLLATGPIPPSSEALTHAATYAAVPWVNCVLHAHCPEIWQQASSLDLPVTSPATTYGTPDMAREVSQFLDGTRRIVVMGGHQDGIIAVGSTVREAALALIECLARALMGLPAQDAMPYSLFPHQKDP